MPANFLRITLYHAKNGRHLTYYGVSLELSDFIHPFYIGETDIQLSPISPSSQCDGTIIAILVNDLEITAFISLAIIVGLPCSVDIVNLRLLAVDDDLVSACIDIDIEITAHISVTNRSSMTRNMSSLRT